MVVSLKHLALPVANVLRDCPLCLFAVQIFDLKCIGQNLKRSITSKQLNPSILNGTSSANRLHLWTRLWAVELLMEKENFNKLKTR